MLEIESSSTDIQLHVNVADYFSFHKNVYNTGLPGDTFSKASSWEMPSKKTVWHNGLLTGGQLNKAKP